MNKNLKTIFIAAGLGLAQLTAGAQTAWPEKPVRIIVPYAPGGTTDYAARQIAQKLTEQTKQSFYVENKAGASGTIGTDLVAKAAPDGYTLLTNDTTYAMLPSLFNKLPWDHANGLVPVTTIALTPVVLVVGVNSPYKTLAELLAYAKANPGKLNFGYFNASSQVPAEVLGKRAGVEWQGVAYKAIGNAWTDLYAGAIQFMFVDLTAGRGQVVANKARPLALTLPARSPLYPDLPTLAESFPGFTSTGFLAIAVPKATPLPVEERLNALINEAITSPEINKRLTDEFALSARPLTLEQCAAQDREERAKWAEYVKIAKIEPQ